MKLKLVDGPDGKKYAAVDDKGLPIYVHDDGREIGFDAVATNSRISALNREAQTHREALEGAQGKLKLFEGIEDPEAARSALNTVKNLKAGDLKTAEQVAEIQAAAQRAAEAQVQDTARQSSSRLAELEKERDTYRDHLYKEKVGGAFSRSKFISDRAAVPADVFQAMFGDKFKVEDGKIVPYGPDGNKIWSSSKGGEVADFEEGLEFLVNGYAGKGSLLKGTNHSGSGAPPQQGGPQAPGSKPPMTRAAFEALDPAAKSAAVKSHQIVDAA